MLPFADLIRDVHFLFEKPATNEWSNKTPKSIGKQMIMVDCEMALGREHTARSLLPDEERAHAFHCLCYGSNAACVLVSFRSPSDLLSGTPEF